MHAVAHVQIPTTDSSHAAAAVVSALRAAGHSAFWVGGCVRDLLLGVPPKDYDVATSATPKHVNALFPQVVQVGVAFGVVRVQQGLADGRTVEVEVATFRKDGVYRDGRRPDTVQFTDAREDVLRRDFTINGLLLDPLAGDSHGQVVDWVGGLADLQARQLRAIGEPAQRFGEDALRLLRAPRFAARFGLTVEPLTAAAIRALAATLDRVSVERIHMELMHMLGTPTAPAALRLLVELGLAAALWPQLIAADPGLARTIARVERLGAVAAAVAPGALPGCAAADAVLAVAALALPDRDWPDTAEFRQSTLFSRHDGLALRQMLELARTNPLPPQPGPPPWPIPWAHWLRAPLADHALVLQTAAGPHDWHAWRQARANWPLDQAFPALGFDGRDLLQWGYAAGPAFKQALVAAENVRLLGGDVAAARAAARAVLDTTSTR